MVIYLEDFEHKKFGVNIADAAFSSLKHATFVSKPGLKLRVCNRIIFFLFLNQNICCGYSKEPSRFSHTHPYNNEMAPLERLDMGLTPDRQHPKPQYYGQT